MHAVKRILLAADHEGESSLLGGCRTTRDARIQVGDALRGECFRNATGRFWCRGAQIDDHLARPGVGEYAVLSHHHCLDHSAVWQREEDDLSTVSDICRRGCGSGPGIR